MAANAVRGDDDVFALLNEMTAGSGGGSSSSPKNQPSRDNGGGITTTSASHESAQDLPSFKALADSNRLSPPGSNPRVEIIRHRCHEKFKENFYDLFRSACGDPSSNGNKNNNMQGNPVFERNHYIKSIVYSVWKSMPPHNVWERFQFSLKTLESDLVREVQEEHSAEDEEVAPWCRHPTNNPDKIIEQLICPTVHQIHAWTVNGRQKGTIWEPLLPVSSIADNSEDMQQINQKYRRGTLTLFEEEIKFQFRRTFKQQLGGGGGRKPKGGNAVDLSSLSIDELHSKLNDLDEATTGSSNKDDDAENEAKKSKKEKKKKKKSKDARENEDTSSNINKEERILQTLFQSLPFERVLQKLHKKFHHLADESYSSFSSDLQKYSQRLTQEEQSRAGGGKKRKRKGQNKGGGNNEMPKISFLDSKNDDRRGNENNLDEDRQLMVTLAGISLKINETHKNKLYSLYQRTLSNLLGGGSSDLYDRYLQHFPKLLFSILLRYDALEGAGLQSAIPPTVFGYLHKRFACEFECFASPFNCWFDRSRGKGGKYGSAFGDTDALFGSHGSFFGMDFLQMALESGEGGCFQANPPFASEFIEKMCNRMHSLLEIPNNGSDEGNTDEEKKKSIPLMFIIFVPAWSDSPGWKTLSSSPHLTRHILLSQKDDIHYYAEGTQHRRALPNDSKGSHRIASFDTSVFFLQNDAAKEKWALADADESTLKAAFAMNATEEEEKQEKVAPIVKSAITQQSSVKPLAESAEAPMKQKKNKKKKNNSVEDKGKGSFKKKKLMTGGNDEMSILASMGILDDSSSKNEGDNRKGKSGNQKAKSVSMESKGGKKRKKRRN